MPRKRLRTFLDEVIGDAELHQTVERVSDTPSSEPPAAPESFPPPPWEKPPTLRPAASNGHVDPAPPAVETAPVEPVVAVELEVVVAEAPVDIAAELAEIGLVEAPFEALPGQALADAVPVPPAFAPDVDVLPPPAAVSTAPATPVDAAVAPPPVTPNDPATAARRRRRSASLLPPLPSPTDIPEDAPGRVAILAVPSPAFAAAAPAERDPAAADPAPVSTVGGDAPLSGWLPVLALGVALVIVFVVGVLVTR